MKVDALNNQISSGGYTYDAAGNMTYDGFHHYSYDAEGRRVQTDAGSTAIFYLYDALNNLVSGHAQGQPESDSLYDLQGRQTSAWSTQTTMSEAHIFADGRQIAFRSADSHTYFIHKDWLSTDRVHTDLNGNTAAIFTSYPWGDGGSATVSESYGGWDFDRFGDLDDDWTSGTYHAQFRHYSQAQGRWLSPDPYDGSYDASNPQSFNRYVYVLNNPLSYIDPSGQEVTDLGGGCYRVRETWSITTGGTDDNNPDPSGVDEWIFCVPTSGSNAPSGPAAGSPPSQSGGGGGVQPTGTIAPSTEPSDAQQRCYNGMLIKSVIAGVGTLRHRLPRLQKFLQELEPAVRQTQTILRPQHQGH